MNWLTILLLACVLVLGFVLGRIVIQNSSKTTWIYLLALILGGLSVITITFVVPLKSEEKKYKFYEDIVIDNSTKLPPAITGFNGLTYMTLMKKSHGDKTALISSWASSNAVSNYMNGLQDLYSFTLIHKQVGATTSYITERSPIDDSYKEEFYLELVINKILYDLGKISSPPSTIEESTTSIQESSILDNGVSKYYINVVRDWSGFKKPDGLNDLLSSTMKYVNASNNLMGEFFFSNLFLPENTNINIDKLEGTITLIKKGFFKINFDIKKIRNNSDNSLPPKFDVNKIDKEYLQNLSAYSYLIDISANFEQLRSESSKMKDYKEWFDWMIKELDKLHSNLQWAQQS